MAVPAAGLSRETPKWNGITSTLIKGTMDLAIEFLADEGFLVTLCLARHVGKLLKYTSRSELRLHHTWTLVCDGGYRHPETLEEICRFHVMIERQERKCQHSCSLHLGVLFWRVILSAQSWMVILLEEEQNDPIFYSSGSYRHSQMSPRLCARHFCRMWRYRCGMLGDVLLLLLP